MRHFSLLWLATQARVLMWGATHASRLFRVALNLWAPLALDLKRLKPLIRHGNDWSRHYEQQATIEIVTAGDGAQVSGARAWDEAMKVVAGADWKVVGADRSVLFFSGTISRREAGGSVGPCCGVASELAC
jgi:hypothetical protein